MRSTKHLPSKVDRDSCISRTSYHLVKFIREHSLSLGGGNRGGDGNGLLSTSGLVILSSDLLKVLVVLFEVGVLFESDEKLGLLGLAVSVTLRSLHGDGLGLDLLEVGILVSI